jgi:tRNA threonylcarbamoyladenosine biosynthesis protein TsaE
MARTFTTTSRIRHDGGRREFARLFPGHDGPALGRPGAGKTAFVRGLAEGLGIDPVTTPAQRSRSSEVRGGRLPLFHVVYARLKAIDVEDQVWTR